MAWADRSNEERLVAEVRRYRETLRSIVVQAKAMHLGTVLHVAESNLAQNHVSDIINNEATGEVVVENRDVGRR